MKYLKTLLFLFLFLVPSLVLADIGPKPSMGFNFEYDLSGEISIVDGQLIECEDKLCKNSSPLAEMGPQRFTCQQNTCSSMSYGYKPYHKIVINFTDKQRESNIFKHSAFNSFFNVKVTHDNLLVIDKSPITSRYRLSGFLLAFFLTIIIELIVAFIYTRIHKTPSRLLKAVLLGNIISIPIMWFIYPLFKFIPYIYFAFEVVVITIESIIIFKMNKELISKQEAFKLGIIMNIISIIIGGAISGMLIFTGFGI